jgi:hypothetical protein
MIQDRAEARARRIQEELEDEQEEAEFKREMEAIQSRSRRFSISSSINEWGEESNGFSDNSQLDTDPLA